MTITDPPPRRLVPRQDCTKSNYCFAHPRYALAPLTDSMATRFPFFQTFPLGLRKPAPLRGGIGHVCRPDAYVFLEQDFAEVSAVSPGESHRRSSH